MFDLFTAINGRDRFRFGQDCLILHTHTSLRGLGVPLRVRGTPFNLQQGGGGVHFFSYIISGRICVK